ncbi:MAG TPA: SOS response-associated peptidase [Thermomicrobiales bacterium]|nr:SOS response-associated peptidase [Thermomicrobiales bacterium]
MCGRYLFYNHQELSERLTNVTLDTHFLDQFRPTWNAAPSQTLPVLVEDHDTVEVRGMHWGLIPKWTKPGQRPKVTPINARSETLDEKPMFRSLVKYRRCIVPSNGFYEWKRVGSAKQPYLIEPADGDLMLFAALYDEAPGEGDDPIQSFTIITTRANDTMTGLHDRMPVILDDDDVETWLDRDLTGFEPLEHLLQPVADDAIEVRPVSRDVNNTRHNGPDLIEPVDEPDQS